MHLSYVLCSRKTSSVTVFCLYCFMSASDKNPDLYSTLYSTILIIILSNHVIISLDYQNKIRPVYNSSLINDYSKTK